MRMPRRGEDVRKRKGSGTEEGEESEGTRNGRKREMKEGRRKGGRRRRGKGEKDVPPHLLALPLSTL